MARIFTPKERSTFEQICKLKQGGVITMMRQFLAREYGQDNMIINPAFVIAKGTIPVALIAHADTVFRAPPKSFFYDTAANVIWSPEGMGADDRAGIFSIIQIVTSGLRPHIIITTDEEHGCIGSGKLIAKYREHPFDNLKFLVQLDRRGTQDSVFYDCANTDFEKFVNDFGFKTAFGSFTDISVIAPAWKFAAVNFSIGYQDEHTPQERLNVGAMFDTIKKVSNILIHVQTEKDCPAFEYIEDIYNYPYASYWWDDGYNLKGIEEDFCCFCGEILPKTDMLNLYYDDRTPFYLCNDCYSKNYEDIEWCSKCNKGWFLSREERNTMGDKSKWLCRNCREDKEIVSGYSESCESSSIPFTGSGSSANRQINERVGKSQTKVHRKTRRIDL